jgi:ferredoxin--NADP+ reductase
MLGTAELWQRFERVVVVHGVRSLAELAYADALQAIAAEHPGFQVVRCVSRQDPGPPHLAGRVTHALETGALEQQVGFKLAPEASHILLCGNPQMIQEMTELLKGRGLQRHRQRQAGHFSFEKYW